MKRKFLAALLALVMVFSMIPVSASADGTIYEGNDTFYYHITDSSLANMVAEKGPAGSSSDVSQVTITFNHDYSAGGQKTFVFRNGYTIALSNVSDYVQPDDIAYLTISFVDGTSVKISQSELNWTWVETLPRRYDLRLATDDNTCTVTFYYQPGDTVDDSAWEEYRVVSVKTGTSLGDSMPALPSSATAHWVAWETGSNNGDGAEFTADTVVHSDLSVYARKVTSSGGSQYHVMNPENSLLEAVLKLYVDENPDSGVTTDDVQISGISVNGSEDSTNPYYDPVSGTQGPTDNGWRDGNSYFFIYNLDAGAGVIDKNTNKRVPPDDMQRLTVYATVDGTEKTYTIPRTELDVRVQSDVIIEIYLRDTSEEEEVTPPAAPDKETVINLAGEDAVAVKCTTNEQHTQVKYELNQDSITVGDVVSDGEGGYTCTVTVEPDSYVTAYNTENPDHKLEPAEQTGEILLVSDGAEWTIAGTAPYVTFKVACETEPEEETPEKPDGTWIANNIKVNVNCVEEKHDPKQYNLEKYTSTNVEKDDKGYFFTITIEANDYVARYNSDVESTHSLDGSETLTVTVRYTEKDDDGYWVANPRSVTINVKCDSGTTEPEVPGITVKDVTTALGDNAIAVKCIDNKHETEYFALDGTTVSLGNVTGSKETGYQCDVTVTLGIGNLSSYLASYNDLTIPQKHGLMSTETITRVLTMKNDANDGKGWYFVGETPIATIDVTCASGETTIPAPDDKTVNNLLGKAVIIDCTNDDANHENEAFSLIEGTYQIGEVYMDDGIPHCDVTITAPDKYAAQYSYNTKTNHPLAPADQVSQAITLKYVKDEWAIDDDGTVYYTVACEDTSTEPTPTPTPTPDPGDDNNPPYIPPYIPPVDPDDSGVSDLLNTDDHIQYLFGYPEGTFGPENNMTRAEVAQMFYNLLLDQDVTITKTFDDVPANAWYAKAVNTLASLGVVSGVGNGDFEPERSITRAEFTSIAMKFAEGKTGGTNIFSDVKSTDWFYRAVVNSTQYGWIHGYGDGTFRPNNPITRVEVTAIVNNMLGREADVDFVTEHYDELNHFSDLAVSHWGYYHIVEATNDHDYTKPSSGENWTELN